MDSHFNVQSQCVLDTKMEMDSPASANVNFYEYEAYDIEKQFAVKQEHLDIEESNLGLGEFLNSEDSVDLQAYLDRLDHQNNRPTLANTGDEIVRQLGNFASHQRLVNEASAVTSGAQSLQQLQTVSEARHSLEEMHVDQDTIIMPLTTQAHVGVEQGEAAAVVPVFTHEYIIDGNSVCSSVASSPGMPTSTSSSDMGSHGQTKPSGSGKRKRSAPERDTDEYKLKRERNNQAVRKSREKTKVKNKELQDKVGELQGENTDLKKRCEMLTKELTVLKSLFTNVGKPVPARLQNAV